jgi:ribosomal protein S20
MYPTHTNLDLISKSVYNQQANKEIMANTSSARKAIQVSHRRLGENHLRRNAIETIRTDLLNAVGSKDSKQASDQLALMYKALDKATKTRVISENKASREKAKYSRLVKNLK